MKYFMFLFILPCILAAEIHNSICTDNTQCSQGKYCCELKNGKSGCCDLAKDLEDKTLVPGVPVSAPSNVSVADPKAMHAYCVGTQCGPICFDEIKWGVCCDISSLYATVCPSGYTCCGSSIDGWCCPPQSRCTTMYKMCRNNVITIPTYFPKYYPNKSCNSQLPSILPTVMIGILSKYFL